MLKFYHMPDCPQCQEIQEILEEMNFAHEVIIVRNRDEMKKNGLRDRKLPLFIHDDIISEGSNAILQHLEELKHFKELWDKFQSDACYCGDKGEIE